MAIFKKMTTIHDIISLCNRLTSELNALSSISDEKQKRSIRSSIYDSSGIRDYMHTEHYSTDGTLNKNSLNYKIKELSGPIESVVNTDFNAMRQKTDYVRFNFHRGVDPKSKMQYRIYAEMPKSKWQRKYSHLKKGDSILLDGPVRVYYTHGYEAEIDSITKQEYYGHVSITVLM